VCELKCGRLCLDAEDSSGCRIQDEHKSPYVTALLSQPVPSYGCMSHQLVPVTHQQVDVILYNMSSATRTTHSQHIHVTVKQSASYGLSSLFWPSHVHVVFLTDIFI